METRRERGGATTRGAAVEDRTSLTEEERAGLIYVK